VSVRPNIARGLLTALILTGAGASLGCLLVASRGGAISQKNLNDAMVLIGQLYAPLVGVFLAFHFPVGPPLPTTNRQVPGGALLLAALLIAAYVFAPVALLVLENDIENIIELLRNVSPLGQIVSSAVMVFFYSRY